MGHLLQKLEKWLDTKIKKLDREHQFLKRSDKKWHRWLWTKLFKPAQKNIDILINAPHAPTFLPTKASKIIHVVNLLSPHLLKNKDLARRVALTLESIEKAANDKVILLGCTSQPIRRHGWQIKHLSRDAKTELNNKIDAAYLKDMLQAAGDLAKKGDIIMYSNLDCPVHPDIYKNLLDSEHSITEFIRRDVQLAGTAEYEDIFKQPFTNYTIGVDAIALKQEVLTRALEIIPDFVIGEPHWDTAVSGILNQLQKVEQNTQDLYHIDHPQQWDDNNLSVGGKHNKKLYREAVNYGLLEDELISLKKDCALVLLKDSLTDTQDNTIPQQLRNLTFLQGEVESIFCEYHDGPSPFKKLINRISYLPIRPTNDDVKKLNQKNAIINLLRHYFCDHSYIIITFSNCKPLSLKDLNRIKQRLRASPLISRTNYIALAPKLLEDKILDFFVENEALFPNIRKHSFINDEGLLQLLNNYGHFQSLSVPHQRTEEQLGRQSGISSKRRQGPHRSRSRSSPSAPRT